MTSSSISAKQLLGVALLATGDEIIQGQITNTNTQKIAEQLFEECIPIGMHVSVGDQENDIEAAIHYLLNHHQALIIIGGLGPTSDDRTRFALAKALNIELSFHEPSWQAILDRFKKYNIQRQPESNRQQALFPEHAQIIQNHYGTANGCWLKHNDQLIALLPGPPKECLSMMPNIIEAFTSHQLKQPRHFKKWLLFNVSEGAIAHQIDAAVADLSEVTTGYRIARPYVECKILTKDKTQFQTTIERIEPIVKPYCFDLNNPIKASDQLKHYLSEHNIILHLTDQATRGALYKTLLDTNTFEKIKLNTTSENGINITIEGLSDFWETESSHHDFSVNLKINQQHHLIQLKTTLRDYVIDRFVEAICQRIILSF